MADEWSPTTLGECIDVKHGFAFKGEFIHEEPDGDILLTPGNFAIGGGFKGDKFKYYSGPDVPEFILRQGDLLVSMTDLSKDGDTLGYPAFVPKSEGGRHFLHNQRLGKIHVVASTKINTGFLHYLLCSSGYRNEILGSATGSTVRHTSPDRIKRFEFLRPRVTEQRAIAHILGTLDDRIEANRRMAATLEEMARVLFRAWFVTFEPVRAKAEGRWRPGQTLPGLPASLYDLFPDRLVETERGEIPEGWRAGELGDVAQQVGQTVSPETLDPNTPYIGLEHMPRRSIALSDWESACKVTSGKLAFQKYDFLFGKLRPYFHKVGIAPVDGICSTDIVVLNARERTAAAFALVCISQDEFVAFTDRTSDGTKMPRTSWSRMKRYGVCLPNGATLQAFSAIASPMLDRIVVNVHESRTLAATRDLLLPRLMSGEVRVKDAEGFLKARGL